MTVLDAAFLTVCLAVILRGFWAMRVVYVLCERADAQADAFAEENIGQLSVHEFRRGLDEASGWFLRHDLALVLFTRFDLWTADAIEHEMRKREAV
jgi:hypothetical protein